MKKLAPTAIVLWFLVIVGFLVRLYKIDVVPAGFFADEASIGYNAYALLTKGTDEYDIPHPFFFRSFGDYRLPVPIYSNIPFVAVFGLNEFSVRLTTALFGTGTIVIIYFLTQRLFQSKPIALFASLFLTISPWHIHFSRFGSEYIYFPFWFSLALYLFLKGLENKKFLFISFFVFGISLYTYYTALFTVPIFLLLLITIFFKRLMEHKRIAVLSVGIFFITLLPFLKGIQEGTVLTRWQRVSILVGRNQETTSRVVSAYIAHFSPAFLFAKGDIDYPGHFITRFSVRGTGELYWLQLPLLILGISSLFFMRQIRKQLAIIGVWFILYPLGSSLTGTDGGGPFAFRSIFGVIPFQILSGVGLVYLISLTKMRIIKVTIITLFLVIASLSFKDYLYRYFVEYPLYSSDFWGWQYGPREIMKYFLSQKDNYDQMYIMGNFNSPEIFIRFYDPENTCQNSCQIGGLEQLDFSKSQLFAIGFDRFKEMQEYGFEVKKIINYPNATPAFYIGEIK